MIFDIKRGSIDDGPGIRTVIFFKGCPLSCQWCHNPESQNIKQEYYYDPSKCIGCRKCEIGCPTNAYRLIGKEYTIEELVDIILEDKSYYDVSGGGVTFSGGEPTLHIDFICSLAKKLKELGISMGIETCGYFDFEKFEKLLGYLDFIYFDVKLINSELHKKYTGKDNSLILKNLRKLSPLSILIPRTPLVPDVCDIDEIRNYLEGLGIADRHVLLPYFKPNKVMRKNPYV